MLKEQYKQTILPIKSELENTTQQQNYSKQKERKRREFFENRWSLIKNLIRSWSTQSESLSDFWRELLSNKDLDIYLPKTPLLNQRLLENLAELETLVIYCCPAFGISENGGYDLTNTNLYDDVGKAGLFIIETLKSMRVSLEKSPSLKNITIVMPVNEVKIDEEGQNLKNLKSTANMVCAEIRSIFPETNITYNLSEDIYPSSPNMQDTGEKSKLQNIDTLSLKIQSVFEDIVDSNPLLKLKFDSMINTEISDGNNLYEAEKELFCYVAEQILLTQKFDSTKTIVLNTENYKTPALAQEILEQILSNQEWKNKIFDSLEGDFLPVLITQKNRFKINTKSLWQQRNSQ